MQSINDLWEAIGAIPEEETPLVLVRLFNQYEEKFKQDPENVEVSLFFRNLGNAITQTVECNLNRR
jgi:hypothetical protein